MEGTLKDLHRPVHACKGSIWTLVANSEFLFQGVATAMCSLFFTEVTFIIVDEFLVELDKLDPQLSRLHPTILHNEQPQIRLYKAMENT